MNNLTFFNPLDRTVTNIINKPWKLLSTLFYNQKTFLCLFSVIIQQAIIASSTIFIIYLGKSVANHELSILFLALFIVSPFIVYIPVIFSFVYLQKSKLIAFKRYVLFFCDSNQGRTIYHSNTLYRKEHEPWLTNEGYLVINETSVFFYNWITASLNALFNVLVIGAMIEPLLVAAYIVSFCLLFFSSFLVRNKIGETASTAQKDRNRMNQILLSGWDNIFVANNYTLTNWKQLFHNKWESSLKSSVHYEYLTNIASSVMMILALLPITVVTLWFFYTYFDNYITLAALVITFPRQIQVIQNIFAVFSYLMQWNGLRAKLMGLIKSIDSPGINNVDNKIEWNKLIITNKEEVIKLTSVKEFADHLVNKKKGRITVRGPNGIGKSILLSGLKEYLKEKAFHLPVGTDLIFQTVVEKNLSHGEKIIQIMSEIRDIVKKKILLLDEWDANLDNQNIILISNQLDLLAEHNTIVEVRHRANMKD